MEEYSFYERPYTASSEMGLSKNGDWVFSGYREYCANMKTFEFRRKDRKTNKSTPLISISWIPSTIWTTRQEFHLDELKARLSATGYKLNIYEDKGYQGKSATVIVYYPAFVSFQEIEPWVRGIILYIGTHNIRLPSFTSRELRCICFYYRKHTPLEQKKTTSNALDASQAL